MVVTGVTQNGSLTAEVSGIGNTRVQVAVHPDVNPDDLRVGRAGFVSREQNCLLAVSPSVGSWKDTASFEQYLSPTRILLRDRETLVAVDVAEQMRDVSLKKGDLVGFDRDGAAIAYERIETPQNEHLFDENVTDDFSQLAGLNPEIARLKWALDFHGRRPDLAAKYGLKSKSSILLVGPPGNGKTCLARCCAGYIRKLYPDQTCRFMHVAGSRDNSMWFGLSGQRITERFDAVREAATDGPVVMFCDEIDALAKRRGTDLGSGEPDRILNTLLSELDGIVPLSNVVLLFATNRADALDPALLRPGRVDEIIEIPRPRRIAAEAILRRYLERGLPLTNGRDVRDLVTPLLSKLYAPNGEYAQVACVKTSDGREWSIAARELLSGAMLENVVQTAARQAATRESEDGQVGLTSEDLQTALAQQLRSAVAVLSAGNVKSYAQSIPQDAQPISVTPVLDAAHSTYIRVR